MNSPPKLGGEARRAGVVPKVNFAMFGLGTTRLASLGSPPDSGGELRPYRVYRRETI